MNESKKSFDSDDDRSYGTVGIYNLGNTCFLNTGEISKNEILLIFTKKFKSHSIIKQHSTIS